jgi:hypothetical protein
MAERRQLLCAQQALGLQPCPAHRFTTWRLTPIQNPQLPVLGAPLSPAGLTSAPPPTQPGFLRGQLYPPNTPACQTPELSFTRVWTHFFSFFFFFFFYGTEV